jgi:hypothetical protein
VPTTSSGRKIVASILKALGPVGTETKRTGQALATTEILFRILVDHEEFGSSGMASPENPEGHPDFLGFLEHPRDINDQFIQLLYQSV